MQNPETTTVFAGVDGRTETDLPAWYEQRHQDADVVSFAEAIRTLPRATQTTVAYENPYSGEWVETERFNAIVEPTRIRAQAGGADTDPLFHVPSNSYAIINSTDVYEPLEDLLREETIEDRQLGEVVFGEIRQYRGGGEVHMDLMFDGLSVELPGRTDPITMGVTSGYDFFGGHAVYVEGFARDTACANSIRQLTDREVVKHVGDVGDFRSWWEGLLGQIELVGNDLFEFIVDAQEITIEFAEMPFDLEGFYELLDYPEYLARHGASDARANAEDPFEIDMGTLHSGATYALTHFFSGKEGTALDRYVRTANDILFNPEATIATVEQTYEREAASETDGDGQTGLESQVALAQLERVGQAVRSPDVIRYLVKALFDSINGADAFSHRDLHGEARRMHERQSAPTVSDPDLEQALGGIVSNRARTFDEIMAGVANRLEKIPVDQRLARIFNHVPEEDDPHFDLAAYLNEDVVILFDTGELRSEAQRVLSLVILSNLWTALRRRKGRDSETEHPLVNLYLEEAASIAVSDLLKQLLAQSRGFDCSVTLSMQFPAQLRSADQGAYDEVLNNVSTFVTGNVPVDRRLAERLATDDMDVESVGNRLRALRRGQWLVSLPAEFDDPEPRPFLVGSVAPPPGDPEGARPLSAVEQDRFERAVAGVQDWTRTEAGLELGEPSTPDHEDDAAAIDPTEVRVDSALAHTKRMPPMVEYMTATHALSCKGCDTRYDPSFEGMRHAIECCASLDDVDRRDVPIAELNLKLTPEERQDSEWSYRQLLFLQAVYNAQQLRYDPLEYDLLHDSMLRLQEYVGIERDAVEDLLDAPVLRHDTDHPHKLYTVTAEGRSSRIPDTPHSDRD